MASRARVVATRALPSADAVARLESVADVDGWPLERPPPFAELRELARQCDGRLTMLTEPVDGALIDDCPRARAVANIAVSCDNTDVPAATERGVLVTNTPGALTETTADLTFALLLASARRLSEEEPAVRRGEWGPSHTSWSLRHDVPGTTLGIVGPGHIGAAVARRARGFGRAVLYHGTRRIDDFLGERMAFDSQFGRADFVSAHVPLNAETEHMSDAHAFAKMQTHAISVNPARGGVVDRGALRDARVERRIGGAALDATTPEPLPPDDPLRRAPHLIITPHLDNATAQTRGRRAKLAPDGRRAAVSRERPQQLVNPEAWERRRS